jgi:glutathione S-transferase
MALSSARSALARRLASSCGWVASASDQRPTEPTDRRDPRAATRDTIRRYDPDLAVARYPLKSLQIVSCLIHVLSHRSSGNDASPIGASHSPRATMTCSPSKRRYKFFDMQHSNNAARIRLWLRLNKDVLDDGDQVVIETKWLSHDEIESDSFASINPLKKVPALTICGQEDSSPPFQLFESSVIMGYLEDILPKSVLKMTDDNSTAEDRALVSLIVRCHDLYIASPNCNEPHFSHTQGCMYLDPIPTAFTPARRTMAIPTRAAKVAEIYKQLCWVERSAKFAPYMGGDRLTHADLTWFPTAVFMELLLPLVFDWTPIFDAGEDDEDVVKTATEFPRLTGWFRTCLAANPCFAQTRQEIRCALLQQKERGRFAAVKEAIEAHREEHKWKYV